MCRDVRLMYVEALGRINAPPGLDALVNVSLNDGDEEIRAVVLEQIVARQYKPAVGKYVQSLKNKDNTVVNRAAACLHQKDPSAIGPLIDALVTTHTFHIQKGQPGQTSATFGTVPTAAVAVGSALAAAAWRCRSKKSRTAPCYSHSQACGAERELQLRRPRLEILVRLDRSQRLTPAATRVPPSSIRQGWRLKDPLLQQGSYHMPKPTVAILAPAPLTAPSSATSRCGPMPRLATTCLR